MTNEIINYLVSNDFSILEIEEQDATGKIIKTYWMVNVFIPCKSAGMESVDYNTIKGFEITDFANRSIGMPGPGFLNGIRTWLEKQMEIEVKFSALYKWKWYTK